MLGVSKTCREIKDRIYGIQQDRELLKTENERLRELVSILCFCMQIHKRCEDCKLDGMKGEMAHDLLLACDALHAMLRELGIEVKK